MSTNTSIDMLARLVAFPTVSRDSNLPLIDWVEEYLEPFGARCRRTPNDDGTKANLFAAIGPDAPGGVVLSGHTDVVPVDGQDWHTDPFKLTERDGLLYGRGSADMKGFAAAFLARLGSLDVAAMNKPLYLALSYDEEVGCLGIDRMVDDALAHFAKPDFAIIGEPTLMQVVRAHKSINVFRTVVQGGSQPDSPAAARRARPRASRCSMMRPAARMVPAPRCGWLEWAGLPVTTVRNTLMDLCARTTCMVVGSPMIA